MAAADSCRSLVDRMPTLGTIHVKLLRQWFSVLYFYCIGFFWFAFFCIHTSFSLCISLLFLLRRKINSVEETATSHIHGKSFLLNTLISFQFEVWTFFRFSAFLLFPLSLAAVAAVRSTARFSVERPAPTFRCSSQWCWRSMPSIVVTSQLHY